MAADHGLLTLTQLQQEQQQQQQQQQQEQNPNPNPRDTVNSWMWNKRRNQDEDDSWEVRAFAEDTGNIMGTTWPPRSYTCTFCRREFRSAQALGGHMNVHRRDRARLRQSSPGSTNNDPSSSSTSTSTLIFPSQEFVANGGLCLLYPLTSPTTVFNSNSMNGCMESPSTLLSNSPFQMNNFMSSVNFTEATTSINASSICHTSKLEPIVDNDNDENDDDNKEFAADEDLDLELRLGSRPTQP